MDVVPAARELLQAVAAGVAHVAVAAVGGATKLVVAVDGHDGDATTVAVLDAVATVVAA